MGGIALREKSIAMTIDIGNFVYIRKFHQFACEICALLINVMDATLINNDFLKSPNSAASKIGERSNKPRIKWRLADLKKFTPIKNLFVLSSSS